MRRALSSARPSVRSAPSARPAARTASKPQPRTIGRPVRASAPSSPLLLNDSEGDNRYFVAARDVARGERLLLEEPLHSKRFDRRLADVRGVPLAVFENMAQRIGERVAAGRDAPRGSPEREEAEAWASLTASKVDLEWAEQFTDGGEKGRVAAQVRTNAFRVRANSVKDVLLLYRRSSLFNHSCWPNAACAETEDNRMVVHALEDVPAGAPMTICYYDDLLYQPRERRQQVLADSWGFQCRCPRCRGEAGTGAPPESATEDRTMGPAESRLLTESFQRLELGMLDPRVGGRGFKWVKECRELLERLRPTDWRAMQARQWYLEACVERYPARLAAELVAQIEACAATMPALHPSKMMYFSTFVGHAPDNAPAVLHALRAAEPHFDEICTTFPNEFYSSLVPSAPKRAMR